MVLPVVTALAYFTAVGSATFANVQAAATSPSTISIIQTASTAYIYKNAASVVTPTLQLGGSVAISVDVTCTAGAPCQLGTPALVLNSWTSNKAGCDSTTLAGSFTLAANGQLDGKSLATVGAQILGTNENVTWNSLASTRTPARVKAEVETLRRQRKTYEAQLSDDPKPAELEGVAAKWKSADPAMRHELLRCPV
jgi:hypothetical protein